VVSGRTAMIRGEILFAHTFFSTGEFIAKC